MQKHALRRLIAVFVSAVSAYIVFYLAFPASSVAYLILSKALPDSFEYTDLNTDDAANLFGIVGMLFVAFGVAVVVLALFWNPGFSKRREALIILVGLLCTAPFSAINWMVRDRLISYEAQTLLDFILVVLGIVIIINLLEMVRQAEFKLFKVLASVGVFLTSVLLVFLPGMYGTFYLLTLFGAIDRGTAGPSWIEPVGALGGLAVAIVTLVKDWRGGEGAS